MVVDDVNSENDYIDTSPVFIPVLFQASSEKPRFSWFGDASVATRDNK